MDSELLGERCRSRSKAILAISLHGERELDAREPVKGVLGAQVDVSGREDGPDLTCNKAVE